jgi:hypothetical protein
MYKRRNCWIDRLNWEADNRKSVKQIWKVWEMEKCLRRKDGSRRREHRSRSEWRTRERYRMRGGERFEHRWPPWTARLSSEERLKMCERVSFSRSVTLWVYGRKVVGEETRVKWVVLDWERKKIDLRWRQWVCILYLMTKMSFLYFLRGKTSILQFRGNIDVNWVMWLAVECDDFLSLRTRFTFFSEQKQEFLSYAVVLVQILCTPDADIICRS